jgi:hypothetical protein
VSSSERLRREIDSGRTGDKTPFTDPAAAPLGADDEAAGTPPTKDRTDAALASELKDGAGPDAPALSDEAPRDELATSGRKRGPLLSPIGIVVILVAAAFAAAAISGFLLG